MAGKDAAAAKAKAERTYDAASDHFDAPQLDFWRRTGARTIERLDLKPGMHVLDVGCGTGASALPAARAVGPSGRVVGIDLSEKLLASARRKADDLDLAHVEFRKLDMTASGYADGAFDSVVSVFSVFFVPDMESLVAEFWRLVRPGGKLAITTWGPDMFEPVYSRWNAAVRNEREDLFSAFNPWDRITAPAAVRKVLCDAGIPERAIAIEAEEARQSLFVADDWWAIVLGSGLRWTADQMGAKAAARVRSDNIDWIAKNGVESVAVNVIYASAAKGT